MASTSDNNVAVEKKTRKAKIPKVEAPVIETSTSKIEVSQEEKIDNLINQVSQIIKKIEVIETEIQELKQQNVSSSQTKQTIVKKEEKEKKTRAPTAYNLFMKEKMLELKDTHSSLSNIERMKMAAEAWSESKKS